MEKKQTAVQWLEERYKKNINLIPSDFEQAKAMEKEQIKNAYVKGQSDCEIFTMESESEQYYIDTYQTF